MLHDAKKSTGVIITTIAVVLACLVTIFMFRDYILHPWTRDGQVQADVIQITPRVTGPIIELPIIDNQTVKKGDLLFKIDPRTFQAKVNEATASLAKARAASAEAKDENERIHNIYKKDKAAVSLQKVTGTEHALQAAIAGVEAAEADLHSAKLDLEFTEVTAPEDGYITNLNLQIGTQVVANQPTVALVDYNTFWVYGYFKETQIGNITPGDKVIIKLMSYPNMPVEGVVDSLGWGIAQQDGSTGVNMLPSVNPSFDWIRLAQRIPVRVHLTKVPSEVKLRVGMTASVFVKGGKGNKASWQR